jgi:hypothetical protein
VSVLQKKVKLSCDKSSRLRGGKKSWAFIVTVIFGTTRTTELPALLVGHLYPEGDSLVLIFLEAEYTTGLLKADRRFFPLQIYKYPARNPTRDLQIGR